MGGEGVLSPLHGNIPWPEADGQTLQREETLANDMVRAVLTMRKNRRDVPAEGPDFPFLSNGWQFASRW